MMNREEYLQERYRATYKGLLEAETYLKWVKDSGTLELFKKLKPGLDTKLLISEHEHSVSSKRKELFFLYTRMENQPKKIEQEVNQKYLEDMLREQYEQKFDIELQNEWLKTEEGKQERGEQEAKETIAKNEESLKVVKHKIAFLESGEEVPVAGYSSPDS